MATPRETSFYVDPTKRSIVLPGMAADKFYNFSVRGYRRVDKDINAQGVIFSDTTQAKSWRYQPSVTVAFNGDITGTIRGVSSAVVIADLRGMTDDGVLSRVEKPQVVLTYNQISAEYTASSAKAIQLGGIESVRSSAEASVNSLNAFLAGLTPAWNDLGKDTPVNPATFQAAFSTAQAKLSDLSAAIADRASQLATWAGVTGPNKPKDNADVTGDNTSKDTAAVGGRPAATILKGIDDALAKTLDPTPPPVPTGLAISSTIDASGSVKLIATWNPVTGSKNPMAGYVLALKETAGGNYIEFMLGESATRYERTVPANTVFVGKVKAFDRNNNYSGFSSEVTATSTRDTVAPGPVTGVSMSLTFNGGVIRWTSPTDADLRSVRVILKLVSNNAIVQNTIVSVAPGGNGSLVLSGLQKGTSYFASLYAIDQSGNESVGANTPNVATASGISLDDFPTTLSPVQVVTALPANGDNGPAIVIFNGKIYRWVSTTRTWESSVDGADVGRNSIPGDALVPNTSLPSTISVSGVGGANSLIDAFKRADWSNVAGDSKPKDNAGRVLDTRTTDELPSFYYALGLGERQEFKNANFGASGSIGFGHLITTTQWGDPSGGPVKQVLTDSDNSVFIRRSINANAWAGWDREYSTVNKPRLGSGLLASTGIAVTDAMALNAQQKWAEVTGVGRPQDGATADISFGVTEYGAGEKLTVEGNTITKTAGGTTYCDAAGEAGVVATSRTIISGASRVSWGGIYATQRTHVGFVAGTNRYVSSLVVGIKTEGNYAYATVNGVQKESLGIFDANSRFELIYDNSRFMWFHNGQRLKSLDAAPGATYIPHFHIAAPGTQIAGIAHSVYSDNAWSSVAGAGKPDSGATIGDNVILNANLATDTSNWTLTPGIDRVAPSAGDPAAFFRATVSGAAARQIYIPVPAGARKLYLSYYRRHSQSGRQTAIGVEFTTADNNYGGGAALNDFSAVANVWGFVTQSFDVPSNVSKLSIIAQGDIIAGQTFDIALMRVASTESGSTMGAPAGTKVGDTDSSTIETRANDPATRINENTVTIDGGKITADTIDARQIKADAIETKHIKANQVTADKLVANSIGANKLIAASRRTSTIGLNMRIDNDGALRWNAGAVVMIDDTGALVQHNVSAGATPWQGAPLNIAKNNRSQNGELTISTDPWLLTHPDWTMIAIWSTPTVLNPFAGTGTLINGGAIVTESIRATHLAADSVTTTAIKAGSVVTESIKVGELNGDRLTADTVDANKIKASTILSNTITVNGNTLNTIQTAAQDGMGYIEDTRDADFPPSYYYARGKRTIYEFKTLAAAGIRGAGGTYGTMTTLVQWSNSSGGPVQQSFVDSAGRTFNRISISDTAWGAWKDAATQVNSGSTQIDPGRILIQGATSLDAWRDQTEIKGGAIKANSISVEKMAINARGITLVGCEFEFNPTDGRLYWSSGYVLYTDDAGNAASPLIAAGSIAWGGGGNNYVFWDKGATNFYGGVDNWQRATTGTANTVTMCTWRGGSSFTANHGGSIINGDRITTGTVDANRIKAGTVLADTVIIGSAGAPASSVAGAALNSANNTWYSPDLRYYTPTGNRVTKLTYNGWDTSSYTRETFTGGCVISGRLINDSTFLGLSEARANYSYDSFAYSWHRSGDGNLYCFTGGSSFLIGPHNTYGDIANVSFSIVYDGKTVRYCANGQTVRELTTWAYRTFAGAVAIGTANFYVDRLSFTASADNSLSRADPAARINEASTTIDGGKITAYSITAEQLSTNKLITVAAQIGDLVVSNAHIANLSINSLKLAGEAVTASKLAPSSVQQVAFRTLTSALSIPRT